tara:strand:- start:449 stop:694 length:246 start_codon:yes stop_codon:yes gene_type:complete
MASFRDLKNKLLAETPNKPSPTDLLESNSNVEEEKLIKTFELEEARYMLNLIANSDFKGRDVQIVYNIAIKLQDIVQEINK